MDTKQHSNYESLITFTRASAGHALRPVSYGDELVSNGDFATDTTGWSTNNSTVSVVSGRLRVTDAGTSALAYQAVTTEVGKIYRLNFDYLFPSGNANTDYQVHVRKDTFGGTALASKTTGWVEDSETEAQLIFVATSTTSVVVLQPASATNDYADFDNVSVKEVTFDESDGTLTLFEHPDNIPRVEYDSAGNRLGLLVEESRTNEIKYSQDFDNADWTKTRCTITANQAIAPDGTLTADLMTATGNDARLQDDISNSTDFVTQSVWVKSATGGDVAGQLDFAGLDTQTFTASGEWQRIHTTSTNLSFSDLIRIRITNSGDSLYVWGAQLEKGAFPTSYIKTTGSTATRSADVAELEAENFGYNLDTGTIFYEGQDIADNYSGAINSGGGFHVWFGGDSNNYVGGLYHSGTTGLSDVVYFRGSGTLETANAGTTLSGNGKVAFAYDLGNSISISVDGSTAVTQTATTPTAYNNFDWKIRLGSNTSGSTTLASVYVKQLKFYPRRLTNAQLQDLTS